ncbi:unnamed protein product [Linum trigynum]|uniref:Protein FAR1-RELATED SEQUENCE n=1 Tax=Linum trigynum TaxID=586398 RepID=A0AAV2EAK0_9ROSI
MFRERNSRMYLICANKIKEVEIFEELWRSTVEKLNLHCNEWVSKMYRIRSRWAHAFLVGKFTCGMKSTHRCEAMHSVLKRFLTSRLKLFEFVEQFHRGLRRLRYEELHNDHVSNDSTPVCDGHLLSLEKHAAELFTRDMFFKVRKQMKREPLLYSTSAVTESGRVSYSLSQYSDPNSKWRVTYYPAVRDIRCSCQLFETKGIPCCHCFFVMKFNNISLLPRDLVLKRWCKDAKKDVNVKLDNPEVNTVIRCGTLSGFCGKLYHYASQTNERYQMVKMMWRS